MNTTKFLPKAAFAAAALLSALLLPPPAALAQVPPVVPDPVTDLEATQGTRDDRVRLEWTVPEFTSTFSVYRCPDGEGATEVETLVESAPCDSFWNDMTAEPGVHYRYWIVITDVLGRQTQSNTAIGWRVKWNLPAPVFAHFEVSQGTYSGKVVLSWSEAPDSTSFGEYYVMRQRVGAEWVMLPPEQLAGVLEPYTATSFEDTTAEPGVKYQYWVGMDNEENHWVETERLCGWAGTIAEAPSAPEMLSASANRTDGILVTWKAGSGEVGGATDAYRLYRIVSENETVIVAQTDGTEYLDTGSFLVGQWYEYQVAAVNDYGITRSSNSVAGMMLPETHPVTDLEATQGTLTDRVRLSWTAPDYAATFAVVRLRDQGGIVGFDTLSDSLATPGYEDTTAEPGVEYRYRVDVTDIWGRTSHSAIVDGWRAPETPVATNLEATQGTLPDRVQLSWSGGPYAASFKVRRWRGEGYTDLVKGLTVSEYDDMTAEPGEEYRYQIFLTDVWGRTSESDFATGWVGERPENDDFENAWAISSKSGSSVATNLLATGQAGEPFPDSGWYIEDWRGIGASNTLWWSYAAPCAGIVRFTTDGSHDVHDGSIRTAMAVFTGDALDSLQEVCRAYGDDDHEQSAGWCTNAFEVAAGSVFRIQTFSTLMDDGGPGRGTMCLNWGYTHYRVTFDPNGGTIATNAVMVPVGQKLGDAMATFPVPVKEGYRFVDWKFENNASVSASAAFAITESHALTAEWAWISSNDDFEDALRLNVPGQVGGFSEMPNTNATLQAGEPLLAVYPGATHTLWWSWIAAEDCTVRFSTTNSVDTFGSQIDTVLGVYTGGALGSLEQVAVADDGVDESGFIDDIGTFWSFAEFEAKKGTIYYICVGVNDKYTRQVVEGTIRLNWGLVKDGVSSGGYALLPPGSSGVDIPSALGESADPSLADLFGGDVDAYNDFAEWANEMGADDVRASAHAAASYQLGTTELLQNDPEISIERADVVPNQGNASTGEGAAAARPRDAGAPVSLTLVVTVRDGGEAVEVTAAKVAALVEATRDVCDWDSPEAKLDPHAGAVTVGSDTTVTIVATPGDGFVPQAFLRIAP